MRGETYKVAFFTKSEPMTKVIVARNIIKSPLRLASPAALPAITNSSPLKPSDKPIPFASVKGSFRKKLAEIVINRGLEPRMMTACVPLVAFSPIVSAI